MSEDSFKKVKKGLVETAGGLKDTVEGVAEGLVDTAQGAKETAEDVKEGAEKVTDSDTYSSSDQEKENRDYIESGGKEPMNPEDIAAHEPTAVKRDQNTEIAGEGETGADSPEAREKLRKKGMTET